MCVRAHVCCRGGGGGTCDGGMRRSLQTAERGTSVAAADAPDVDSHSVLDVAPQRSARGCELAGRGEGAALAGKRKPAVFPEPVCAHAIKSAQSAGDSGKRQFVGGLNGRLPEIGFSGVRQRCAASAQRRPSARTDAVLTQMWGRSRATT